MTPEEVARLVTAFTRGDREINELSDYLYLHKVRVYEDTLSEIADGYGYDATDISVSDAILEALSAESDKRATQIVGTYNRQMQNFVASMRAFPYEQAVGRLADWSDERDAKRAQLIAVTEAYSAHADATVSFFIDNGIDVEFDFGHHHGDAPAECPICQALEARNPHPLDRVLEIGTPHPQCRQKWHALIDGEALPDEVRLGLGDAAGIVGRDSLIHRAGGQEGAVREVESLG